MRRFLVVIFVLFTSIACWSCSKSPTQPTLTPTSIPATPTQTSLPATPIPIITETPTFTPLPVTPTISVSVTPLPRSDEFVVYYHPDDMLYVGDQVSIEVVSPEGLELKDAELHIQVDPPEGPSLSMAKFAPWGIQGRDQATLLWAWDTKDESPGTHTLSYSVQPQGYSWTAQVTLLPTSDMPPAEANAQWASTQTQCCTVFYITNTASDRDITTLSSEIDQQASDAISKMGANFTEPITVTVLPRTLGHGGFTSNEISVTYLDRNYASNDWALVVHHEMIHAIDGKLGGDFRPTIFVEGLAVYMTGGHYKPEPLMPRAAALLPNYLNMYIPLKTLTNDFYASQHEIGYLEGAALIEYMVRTYGWEAWSAFYRDMHNKNGESQSDSIEAALQAHFSISFDQLEQDFLAALASEPDTPAWVDDMRLTVTYFDTMRRYQQLMDPSAYFRTAWLLDNKTMRQRGIVADYLRHPHTPENLALETLLLTVSQHMADKKYDTATQILEQINAVLDAIEHSTGDPFSASPLAADYLAISDTLQKQGYEVQKITINGDAATVKVTQPTGPELLDLTLTRSGGEWVVSP